MERAKWARGQLGVLVRHWYGSRHLGGTHRQQLGRQSTFVSKAGLGKSWVGISETGKFLGVLPEAAQTALAVGRNDRAESASLIGAAAVI